MYAQKELKSLLTNIDHSSSRALAGVRKVRASAKVKALPTNKQMIGLQVLLFGAFASFVALWINSGL